MHINPILNTDSYKASHYLQMPPSTEVQSSYIESRGGTFDHTVVFGLQMFLKEYLTKPIVQQDIDEAEEFFMAHGLPFNRVGWTKLLNRHGGYFPLEIQAVAEGTVLPIRNVMVQAQNTDPDFFWLTSYIETAMLRAVWYPTTVATVSFYCKKTLYESLMRTSEDPDGHIGFKLHDFGGRGVNVFEGAGVGGAAHLVNFRGTDTIAGVLAARRYYSEPMAGFSIPASEHSTITSWGGPDQEVDAFSNMLDKFAKPGALVACVSDSYDIYRAAREIWGTELKDKILQSGATLVIRPDSGDPVSTPVKVMNILAERFGYTENAKGYKVLNPAVKVIQGDGIDHKSLRRILEHSEKSGFSTENISFGMGGGLLQQSNRDTQEFAMKCSGVKVNGRWRDVWKDPIEGMKVSKRGRLALVYEAGLGSSGYRTIRQEHRKDGQANELRTVYLNGNLEYTQNFAEVRELAQNGLNELIDADQKARNGQDRY